MNLLILLVGIICLMWKRVIGTAEILLCKRNKECFSLLQNGNQTIESGSCIKNDSQIQCFPSFIIAGVMKAGTGELMRQLNRLPNIQSGKGLQNQKEIHFFDNNANFEQSFSNQWYISYIKRFPVVISNTTTTTIMTFDKSPSYIRNANAMEMIRKMFPDIKIIVILRNPILRSISGFLHNCRHKRYVRLKLYHLHSRDVFVDNNTSLQIFDNMVLPLTLWNQLKSSRLSRFVMESELKQQCSTVDFEDYVTNWGSAEELAIGFYDIHLSHLYSRFSHNQILILFQEIMKRLVITYLDIRCMIITIVLQHRDTQKTIDDVKYFLNISNFISPFHKIVKPVVRVKSSNIFKSLKKKTLEYLKNVYGMHVTKTVEILHKFNISVPSEFLI